jgi:hypothetical protein
LFVRTYEKGAERLAVRRRNKQLFVVTETKLGRPGHVGSGVWGETPGIDEFAATVVSEGDLGTGAVAYFCLKYRRLLQRAATPDDAISGSRRYDMNESKAEVMVVDLVWGICRGGIYMGRRSRFRRFGVNGKGGRMCLHLSMEQIQRVRQQLGRATASRRDDLGVSPGVPGTVCV